MTVQMEHTTCEDLLKDDAAVLSEFDLILLFSLVSNGMVVLFLCKYVPHMQLQQTGTYDLNEM